MQWLSGYPVILSEYMTDTVDAVIVKRTFHLGARKGKRASQLTKVYVLAKAYQVPSESYLLTEDGHVIMHPALWQEVRGFVERSKARFGVE